jgi:hypothetical protein
VKKILIVTLLVLFLSTSSKLNSAYAKNNADSKETAQFIIKLVETFEPRNKSKSNQLYLCNVGMGEIQYFLKKELETKNVVQKNKHIKFVNISKEEEFEQCDIIYISQNEESIFPYILSLIKKENILTISEIENFINKGGIIQIYANRRNEISAMVDEERFIKGNTKTNYAFSSLVTLQ